VNILPARCIFLAGTLALIAGACSSEPSPVAVKQRLEVAGASPIDLTISLQPEHQRLKDRYAAAVASTLKEDAVWLGSYEPPSLTIVDPPWKQPTAPAGRDVVVLDRTPWWSAPTSMTPELAVARSLGRRRWDDAMAGADLPSWFTRGLVEYSARRAVLPLFEGRNLSPGYAFLEQRSFDGFVPRFVRIRLLPETDGDPLPAFRTNQQVRVQVRPRSAADARSLEAKTVLILGTLERWLGRPVLDQVIAEFVRDARGHRTTMGDFARIATDVSGQDLSWLMDQAFGSSNVFDYGVAALDSRPDGAGMFDTTVVTRRYGDGLFTGSSAKPIGPFESGRGVVLRVTFADGEQRTDYWDGRAREKTFRYRGPAQAKSAVVDPDRTMLLDLARTNNSITLASRSGVAASVWSVRYLLWLQDLLLTYASLG
jgi:hypothetical protein